MFNERMNNSGVGESCFYSSINFPRNAFIIIRSLKGKILVTSFLYLLYCATFLQHELATQVSKPLFATG